jgi:hypothetical protein
MTGSDFHRAFGVFGLPSRLSDSLLLPEPEEQVRIRGHGVASCTFTWNRLLNRLGLCTPPSSCNHLHIMGGVRS